MNNDDPHILVVDDDDGIRNLVKQFLNENNFLVTTAINAEDAENKIKFIKFDLIVLDVMMPGKNGINFILDNKNIVQKYKKYTEKDSFDLDISTKEDADIDFKMFWKDVINAMRRKNVED